MYWLKMNVQLCVKNKALTLQNQNLRQVKICLLVFLFYRSFFWSVHVCAVFLWGSEKSNRKYLLELIKWRWKVHQNNMSRERTLNLDHWKLFSENYKPMRVWLWFAYKITEAQLSFMTLRRVHSNSK